MNSVKISNKTTIILNGMFHLLILFMFLSILYFTVINPLEKKAFEDEMENEIKKGVSDAFDDLDENIKAKLKEKLNTSEGQEIYNRLVDKYSEPSEVVTEHNKLVVVTCIITIVIIFITLVGSLLFLKYLGNRDIGLFEIISENILTFLFVGVVEYLFFTQIAFKYVPAPPSLLVESLIDSFKDNL